MVHTMKRAPPRGQTYKPSTAPEMLPPDCDLGPENRSGWGYDYIPLGRKGNIDVMPVVHTRPVQSINAASEAEIRRFWIARDCSGIRRWRWAGCSNRSRCRGERSSRKALENQGQTRRERIPEACARCTSRKNPGRTNWDRVSIARARFTGGGNPGLFRLERI